MTKSRSQKAQKPKLALTVKDAKHTQICVRVYQGNGHVNFHIPHQLKT